jgi:predicted RNA-binding protein
MKAPISEFEEELISEYIHLEYLIETLENDLNMLNQVPLKIKDPYKLLIEETLKKVRSDLKNVKSKMKELDIKVFSQRRVDDMFVEYPYFAHGYHGSNKYWDAALIFASSKRMKKYLGQREID